MDESLLEVLAVLDSTFTRPAAIKMLNTSATPIHSLQVNELHREIESLDFQLSQERQKFSGEPEELEKHRVHRKREYALLKALRKEMSKRREESRAARIGFRTTLGELIKEKER